METIYEVLYTRTLIRRQKRTTSNANLAATVLQGSRSSSKPADRLEMASCPDFASYEWHAAADDEHHFIDVIREAIEKYRLQSAAHYDVEVDVHQVKYEHNPERQEKPSPIFKILVGFHNFGRSPVMRMCGPESRRTSRKTPRTMTGNIVVYEKKQSVSFEDFLELQFPLHGGPVRSDVMYKWWRDNDKMFNWAALPTELKEHILRYCLHDTSVLGKSRSPRWSPKKLNRVSHLQRRGPHEITDRFDKASSLLRVSHQVRAIALRLCLQGSIQYPRREGLCLEVAGVYPLKDCIRRLGKFHQMLHPDGVPVDEKTKALAKVYKQYPRVYPHLDQYATFAHGIRKMHMCMDYHAYFCFFKVTVGGFSRYCSRFRPSYEILEQLPHLRDIVLELPDPRSKASDRSSRVMPPLFFRGFECPRILHRLIYEQAAEVLALYPNVKMQGFVDELEEQRFYALRNVAVGGLEFTRAELTDLYKDDGGGIELDEVVYPDLPSHDSEVEVSDTAATKLDEFWPPKCRCAVLCRKILYPDE